MGQGCHGDDAGRSACVQGRQQQPRQREVPQVVGAELQLKAVSNPMPELAPVTTAVVPLRSGRSSGVHVMAARKVLSRFLQTTSKAKSSRTGSSAGLGSSRIRSISLCAPQPWSRLTTRPSEGDQALAHTPKKERSAPAIGTKKPHDEQGSGDCSATGDLGPWSPSYQRCAATSRPSADRTRLRPNPSSHSATASTSSPPVASCLLYTSPS